MTLPDRIHYPLRKNGREWFEISFDEAFELILERFLQVNPQNCALFAGGSATNEELYLMQRLARAGLKTNNVASFEYLLRGEHYCFDKNDIVPFAELPGASQLFCIGFDLNTENAQIAPIQEFIRICIDIPALFLDNNNRWLIVDEYAFFKAINQRLIATNRAKGIFIQGAGKDYERYREVMLQMDIMPLLDCNKLSIKQIDDFIDFVLLQKAPIFIYREAMLNEATIAEMTNFVMLTEMQAKQSSGLLGIKEQANSQGLFDMGLFASRAPGGVAFSPQIAAEMSQLYNATVTYHPANVRQLWETNQLQAAFILYEDPLSETCYQPFLQHFNFDFLCVMAHSLTPTAQMADLVLPGSLPAEIGGIYTDSTRQAHQIAQTEPQPLEWSSLAQLSALSERLGLSPLRTPDAIFLEYTEFLKGGCRSRERHFFKITHS
jgi:predicted molibdopterin-dependent oxidoreductase YjgC